MHRFLIVTEEPQSSYPAYCPDLSGGAATGDTPEEAEADMHESLQLQIEGMMEDGDSIPESGAQAECMVVA